MSDPSGGPEQHAEGGGPSGRLALDAAAASKLSTCPVCGAAWAWPAAAWVDPPPIDRRVAWICLRCGSWWRASGLRFSTAMLARLGELDPALCQNDNQP